MSDEFTQQERKVIREVFLRSESVQEFRLKAHAARSAERKRLLAEANAMLAQHEIEGTKLAKKYYAAKAAVELAEAALKAAQQACNDASAAWSGAGSSLEKRVGRIHRALSEDASPEIDEFLSFLERLRKNSQQFASGGYRERDTAGGWITYEGNEKQMKAYLDAILEAMRLAPALRLRTDEEVTAAIAEQEKKLRALTPRPVDQSVQVVIPQRKWLGR